jgi:integrase
MHEQIQNIVQSYSLSDLEKLSEILNEIKLGKKKELQSSPTLFSFFEEYKKYAESSLSLKYLRSIKQSYSHLINYYGEESKLLEITHKQMEEFKQWLMLRAPKGYSVYLRTIRASFSIAKEWGYITENPFAKIKLRKRQQTKPVFITQEELQKVVVASSNSMLKEIFIFGFNTGCRLGEICSIKWKNIDLEKKTITVGDSENTTKSYKTRLLPMNSAVFNILSKRYNTDLNPQHYVFSKKGGFPFSREYISRVFKRSIRKVQLDEQLHFHSIRHGCASTMAMNGVPITTIKEFLGHSSITTTAIYSHCNMKSLEDAVSKLN